MFPFPFVVLWFLVISQFQMPFPHPNKIPSFSLSFSTLAGGSFSFLNSLSLIQTHNISPFFFVSILLLWHAYAFVLLYVISEIRLLFVWFIKIVQCQEEELSIYNQFNQSLVTSTINLLFNRSFKISSLTFFILSFLF